MQDFVQLMDTFVANASKRARDNPGNKNFSFSRLGPEQISAAQILYNESIKQGIDPRMTLAMGWQENRFRQVVGDQGRSVGMLQVMKTSADKLGGTSPQDWIAARDGDMEAGIRLGVRYIKNEIDNGARTVSDVFAAHNGGRGAIKYTNYGKVRPYVESAASHMSMFNSNAEKVSWGTAPTMIGGQYAPAGPVTQAQHGARPTPPSQQLRFPQDGQRAAIEAAPAIDAAQTVASAQAPQLDMTPAATIKAAGPDSFMPERTIDLSAAGTQQFRIDSPSFDSPQISEQPDYIAALRGELTKMFEEV